ncbi:MAG: hypothetical protein ACK5MY_15730 [Jhaorihella sp.]
MSDPVSKTEIEDVLSSIRRLVSEESWTEQRRVAVPEPAESGRLVLTPSFRVADNSGPEKPGQKPPVGKAPRMARQDDETGEPEDAARPPAAPVAIFPEPGEATGDAVTGLTAGDDDIAAEETAGVDAAPAAEDAPWSDPTATLFASARSSAFAPPEIGGGDVDISPASDAEDTGGFDDGEGEGDEGQRDDPGPKAEAIDAQNVESTEPEPGEDADRSDDPDAQSEAVRAGTLSAKIEALEAAIGRTRDQWEPDGTGMDDYAGTPVETIQWEDHDRDSRAESGNDPHEGRERPAQADPGAGAADVLSSDEAFMDEESLRDLVADIVREELQGALGERITRNVRKLVRREIHRALTAQELD